MPAESVAKVLVDHGINCAILNACESARADQGLRANLAATFLEQGMENVLAMFCKFPSSAIETFFSVFYDRLLRQGLPMSTAAAEARKHLREHGLRKSRFGLELRVHDWFIPVSYNLSHPNVLLGGNLQADSSTTCHPVERMSPKANPLIIGRDFDLLRLEEAVTDSTSILVHGHAGIGKSGLVQYAFDRWKDTQYFGKFSMVNMPKYLRKPEIGGDEIILRIAKDLKLLPGFLLPANGSSSGGSMAGPLSTWRRAVVALDGVDWIFNNVFSREFRPVVEAVSSLLRHLTSSEFLESTGKRVTVILTSRLGREWWEARFPQPLVTPQYFELTGLELSAAVTFAESVLQSRGFIQDKRGSQETDFLVHIVNLLQRNPLAIKVALPASAGVDPPSLKDIFNTIHVGEVHLDHGSVVHTSAYALIAVLESVYRRFPEYQDTLCSLADFWIEGPLGLQSYIRHLAAYFGLSQVYDMSPLIKALNEVGIWRVSKQDKVEWLHPMFTLYLRQRRRTHAYRGPPLWAKGIMKVADFLSSNKREHSFGSTESLQIEIPQRFVSAVGHRGEVEFMTDIVMGFVSDCNMPQSMQRMRGSFFNLLTVLDMICGNQDDIPLEAWPRGFIALFLSASRLALSAPELEMLTGYVQATLDVFQKRIGGFAVHPDFQTFAFNLIVHLFVSALVGGTSTGTWGPIEQLVTQALAMIEASEATYGPMSNDKLMWKAMVYRCQAFFLLVEKDEAGADAAWEHMKTIELDCFGPSAFQPSTFDPSSVDLGQQSATSNSILDLFDEGPESKLQKPVASWVPVRHAAWPWIKDQVLRQGNTQALNQLHIPGIENAFENMVSTYREAGVTGLENWERYYPPRNDLEGYLRRAENPEELLAQLEDGLGRGDWKLAAQAHQLLAKKAAAETKMDVAVFHLEQLVEILGEADPDGLMTKRAIMARDVTKLVLEAKQRGFVTDSECLQMVEMMEEAGLDIKTVYRAQGLPEEFAQAILDVAERAREDRERFMRLVEGVALASGRESNDASS